MITTGWALVRKIPLRSFLDSVDSDWFNQRLTLALVAVLAAFAILFMRLIYLQLIEGQEYHRLSEINSIRLQDIDAPRGLIYERTGKIMVDNRPSFDLHIVLKDANPLNATLSKLSQYVDDSPDQLRNRIRKNKKRDAYKPLLLVEDIGRDTLASIEVRKFDLPGIMVNVSPKRHYLNMDLAGHFLGYMGEINLQELQYEQYRDCKSGDYIGKFGIERSLDSFLRGKRGGRQVEVNATGRIIRVIDTVAANPGHNIALTLDAALQKTAEKALGENAGAVVAVDPRNGKILALASRPGFDPNVFVDGLTREQWQALITNPLRPLENKTIQAVYPPASPYKIITTIAGLEEGIIDSETTYFCPGYYKYGNRVFRCWKRGGHGEVNVVKALAQSCDVFYYQVGEALGIDRLAWYAKACGLGSATGIGLKGEMAGLVPTAAWKRKRFGTNWQGGETLSVAIGQGYNLVTPLQLAILAASVGHNGVRYRPLYIKSIHNTESGEIFVNKSEVIGRLPVSQKNMNILRQGLSDVVNNAEGTAYSSRLKGIAFSGKTGTAQVVGRKTDAKTGKDIGLESAPKDHAWFVAYAPSEQPRIAVSVIVEHGEHGSTAAAPIAKELIVQYLGLEQSEKKDDAFVQQDVLGEPAQSPEVSFND
ncbi:MAG: penicillin-binding protein 2 [Desulfobacteraceae bacterium]|nr:penicillin-binding protein 2 [Desulfobacteraceae bacterium]